MPKITEFGMVEKFNNWLETAAPGDRLEYHRGPDLGKSEPGLAKATMGASLDRKILLMRRKYKADDFGFFAIRVSNLCPNKIFPISETKSCGPRQIQSRSAKADG
jgi:hypothetical protein